MYSLFIVYPSSDNIFEKYFSINFSPVKKIVTPTADENIGCKLSLYLEWFGFEWSNAQFKNLVIGFEKITILFN